MPTYEKSHKITKQTINLQKVYFMLLKNSKENVGTLTF